MSSRPFVININKSARSHIPLHWDQIDADFLFSFVSYCYWRGFLPIMHLLPGALHVKYWVSWHHRSCSFKFFLRLTKTGYMSLWCCSLSCNSKDLFVWVTRATPCTRLRGWGLISIRNADYIWNSARFSQWRYIFRRKMAEVRWRDSERRAVALHRSEVWVVCSDATSCFAQIDVFVRAIPFTMSF